MQSAKNSLVSALSRTDTGFKTTIGGKETKPEGFVAIRGGRPTKLVDRAEFSAANFAMGSFRKGEPKTEPEEETKKKVFTFGRMNPPTIGHRKLADRVQEVAKENNADHEIVMSHSQDAEKNPLTPEQKIKHAKAVLGKTAKVTVTSEKEPNIIAVAKRFEKEGVGHLIMVVGDDRVEEFKKLLDRYNGKEFNFKNIDVVSAGHRDPDAEGVEGMSASKMREHAINGRFREFSKGLPKDVNPAAASEMFADVRKGMDIKIGPETNGISLARYAKRNDPIGVKARAEQKRRELAKQTQKKTKGKKSAASVAKPVATPLVQKIVAKKVASNG
jgi:nicotinic acid mononucleotide adenylyltransferase